MAIHILEPWMEGTCPGWRSSFTRKPQAWWRKCQWIGKLFIHATPHIKPSPRGCYWWTDLEDLRDRFSRSLQKSASGEPESKVESGQLWKTKKPFQFQTGRIICQDSMSPGRLLQMDTKHVHLNLNTKGGKADKAFLSLSGRPHHNINLQFVMKQRRGFDSVCYRIPGCTRRTAWSPQPPQPHTGTIFWFASSKLCASQHMFFCTLTDGLFFQHPKNFGSLKLDCIEDPVIFWKEHLGSWFDSVFFAGATFALWMVNSEWHGPSVPSRPPLTQSLPSRACGRTGWCAETCLISLLS